MKAARKGAYVLEAYGKDVVLVGTGSEVTTVLQAADELKAAGILATVVSMPSFKIFEEQDEAYKMSIFPHGVPKVACEAGATMGWWKYVGPRWRGDRDRPLRRVGTGAAGAGEAGRLCGSCG